MTVADVARRLPGIDELREHCRALATVEAVLSPEWEYRSYSFNSSWAPGEQMASMRDGSGNEWSAVFSTDGVYVRGFDHESPMSPYANDIPWPGVLDSVPAVFQPVVTEPAFCDEDGMPVVTCCLWREGADTQWRHGAVEFPERSTDPDGADDLFALLTDRSPDAYVCFAEDYYEFDVDPAAVKAIFQLQPLTAELVAALNPDVTLADLAQDLAAIGYPLAQPSPPSNGLSSCQAR